MTVLDYAWHTGVPTAAFKAFGATGVARYFAPAGNGKVITADEARTLSQAGLSITTVWEAQADRANEGSGAGDADGRAAVAEAHAIGQPAGSGIYFAVDFDARATAAITAYAKAFSAAVTAAGYRSGVYGGYFLVRPLHQAGIVQLVWQTRAWSQHLVYDGAHLYQEGSATVGGVSCDTNKVMQADYGQFTVDGAPAAAPVVEAPAPVTVQLPTTTTRVTGPAPAVSVADAPITAAVPSSRRHSVIVASGMFLSGIAAACGVTEHAIEAANPQIVNPNHVTVGQRVIVPAAPGAHTVAPPVAAQPAAPAAQAPAAPTRTAPAPSAPRATYTVQRGDTLSSVCARLGCNWQTVARLSGVSGPRYVIKPGMVLTLPSGVSAPAAATSHAAPAGTSYTTVRRTDVNGLSSVASRSGVSVARLLLLNPQLRARPNHVEPGWSLRIR